MPVIVETKTEMSMLSQFQQRHSATQKMSEKRDSLQQRQREIQGKLETIDTDLSTLDGERTELVESEAEGITVLAKDWSALSSKMETLRSQRAHQTELYGVVEASLDQAKTEVDKSRIGLDPYRRGGWAEISKILFE